MTQPAPDRPVLVLNAGSSTVKFAIYRGPALDEVARGTIPGAADSVAVLAKLDADGLLANLGAVGHRLVHGGPHHTQPAVVTPELLADLDQLAPLDPTHLPAELALIRALSERFPGVPQVACFDTAFHRTLPPVARALPLPRRYQSQGVRKYGFHGLSYEFLLEELARVAGAEVAHGRVIFAHLGSGSSLAAVLNGVCIDTTMGFTPTGGLVMGTRTGDLDPGVLVHLLRTERPTVDQLDHLLNHESGLRGLSETSSDVRELLAHEASDPRAAEALAAFCYSVRKGIGALAAVLGGLDALVFAGGIGENAPEVRARVCADLAFLGVLLNPDANAANAASAPLISEPAAPVQVRVIRTNEELMIARTVQRMLNFPTSQG